MLKYEPELPKAFMESDYTSFAVKKFQPHTLEIEKLLSLHFPYITNDENS